MAYAASVHNNLDSLLRPAAPTSIKPCPANWYHTRDGHPERQRSGHFWMVWFSARFSDIGEAQAGGWWGRRLVIFNTSQRRSWIWAGKWFWRHSLACAETKGEINFLQGRRAGFWLRCWSFYVGAEYRSQKVEGWRIHLQRSASSAVVKRYWWS
jgi:hypothetical protein